jgi:multidrug resistance efflux pump
MRSITVVLLAALAWDAQAARELLLTGQVTLKDAQHFITPYTGNFQTSIQWMAEEGSVVNAGDIVVVFDPGELASTIEQNERALQNYRKGAQETLLNVEQQYIDAEHELTQAELRLEIARLRAEVPAGEVSALSRETAIFELGKARNAVLSAQTKIDAKRQELISEEERIRLEVERIEKALYRDNTLLEFTSLRAERSGPVIYEYHPWRGNKLAVGQTVQMGMHVASIPISDQVSVEAWISEVDWPLLVEGAAVELIADAYLDESFTGTVVRIGFQAEKREQWGRSAYYPVTVEMTKRPGFDLKPGMSVLVQFAPGAQP